MSALEVLWARRVIVGVGLLVAAIVAFAGVGATGRNAGASTGVAQIQVEIDQRKPIVADLEAISDTIGTQAALLSTVVAGDAAREQIARRAGVPVAQLGMQRLELSTLYALGELPQRAATAAKTVVLPYVVNVSAISSLPIITIDVSAPTAAAASRIAIATRQTLESLVASRAPTPDRSVVVRPLGSVRSAEQSAPPRSPAIAAVIAVLCFVLWCFATVVVDSGLRAWRRSTAAPIVPA